MLTLSDNNIKFIIFLGENKFNMFYSDGQVTVWRKLGTGFLKKKFNTNCKIWKGINHSTWRLVFIDEKMDYALYYM